MRSKVLVTLFISRVFGDEVKVFAANDQRAVHFSGDDSAGKDTAADGDFASKRTFLV